MKLKLRGHAFSIEVGTGVVEKLIPYLKKNKVQRVVLLSDERLVKARKRVRALFAKTNIEFNEIAVTAGESLKDFKIVYPLYAELLKYKIDRDSVIIALGGGSMGDAAGFIAATYLRGIRWIGLPTTLLAQVDSSVGGKTGVNHAAGKNLIGSFHQPSLVLCDLDFLKTLSPREVASGLGEMVKYAITFDAKFFTYICGHLSDLLRLDTKTLRMAVERSLKFKVKAVEQDEYDRTGIREVLNFGHTFGHALESLTQYKTYQHGEAVVWGMRFAIALSVLRGHLNEDTAKKINTLLTQIPAPALPKKLEFIEVQKLMKKDKKSAQGSVRFVLIQKIGKSISDRDVTETDLKNALARIRA